MDNLIIGAICVDKIPLLDKKINSYTGITHDGKNIYLVSDNHKIISVYDFKFNFIRYINTNNYYVDICFDYTENCFWTVCSKNKVHKLDHVNFCEVDCMNLNFSKNNVMITNISYDYINNYFILMSGNATYICNKNGNIICELNPMTKECNNASCYLDNYIIKVSSCSNSISIIKILYEDFSTENITCLAKDFISKSAVMYKENCENFILILSQKKFKYPYILKYKTLDLTSPIINLEYDVELN